MEPQMLWSLALVLAILGFAVLAWKKQKGEGVKPAKQSANAFTRDITAEARDGKLDVVSGRDAEVERTLHILMRRTKNNPLLLGAPGVGKTAIVQGLAQKIVAGDVPEALKGKQLVALDLASMMSETKFRGELEKRLHDMLETLEGKSRQTILFIDEVHMLVQAGGTEGALNVADIFKPALARGELQIIGATTWDEYIRDIRKDPALDRRFQPVLIDEPTPEAALSMLKTLRPAYERFHAVRIPDEALKAAVELSDKKIKGRYLPDKAIDLIDEASAKVAIECSRSHHGAAMGVVHGAAKHAQDVVSVEDIEDVVDQWVIHSKKDKARDARFEK